jgi:hypothetical protein
MFLSHQLVKHLRGEIKVKSSLSKGTTVSIIQPIYLNSDSNLNTPKTVIGESDFLRNIDKRSMSSNNTNGIDTLSFIR